MATKGHNPKTPSALKKLRGTDQPCRRNDAEPTPDILVSAPCPPHLTEDEVARETWEQTIPLLIGMRVLAASDLLALEKFCEIVSDLRELRDQLKKYGRIIYEEKFDSAGDRYVVAKANPAAAQHKALLQEFRAFVNSYGMSPSARASLKVEPQKADDKKDIFDT